MMDVAGQVPRENLISDPNLDHLSSDSPPPFLKYLIGMRHEASS